MASVPRAAPEDHRILVENGSVNGDHSAYCKALVNHYVGLGSSTYIHEWGHILQAVYYPYLYLRCVRDLGLIDLLISDVQRDSTPSIPTKLRFSREVFESLTMDITRFRLSIENNHTVRLGPCQGPTIRTDICEVDLLEEANSIFEYKVETSEYGTGEAYHNWLKAGSKGYTRVFHLLSRLLGREAAYHLLPPIVAASYRTTYPVSAFASLLESVLRDKRDFSVLRGAQLEAELTDSLCVAALRDSIEPPKLRQLPTDDQFAFISERVMRQYIQESDHHPLQRLAQRVWTTDVPGRGWIYYPHEFVRGYGHSVRPEINDFEPPFMWLIYDSDEVPLSAAIFVLSKLYREQKVSPKVDPEGNTNYFTYINMLLFRRALAQGLFRDPNTPRPSYCHHEGCHYFNSGLCSDFLRIPDVASNCQFPYYLLHSIKRRYSPELNSLERSETNARN
jgi:hypothetical protein